MRRTASTTLIFVVLLAVSVCAVPTSSVAGLPFVPWGPATNPFFPLPWRPLPSPQPLLPRTPVTGMPRPVATEMVSPDGTSIAYCMRSQTDGTRTTTKVMVMPTSGALAVQVTELPMDVSRITWLGNSRLVLTEDPSYDEAMDCSYVVVDLRGRRLPDIKLPRLPLYRAIAPDGCSVAITKLTTAPLGGKRTEGLFVYNTLTRQANCLIAKMIRTRGAWSPDSTRLAIGGAILYTGRYPLWIVDARTGAVEATNTFGVGASWSPDGRYIACVTNTRAGFWYYGVPMGCLGVYDVVDRCMHAYPTISAVGDGICWSSDSRYIAYADLKGVYVIERGSSTPWKVCSGFSTFAAWAGSRLFVIAGREDYPRTSPPPAVRLLCADPAFRTVTLMREWEEPPLW